MPYTCPVCGYANLELPPSGFEICPSCGTEFEYHDAQRSHEELRFEWIANGMHWYSHSLQPPNNWNPLQQLMVAGHVRIETGPAALGTSTQQEYDIYHKNFKVHFQAA
jgi:hypothetical protein